MVEYKVRPVTRYIVTRFEQGAGSRQIGGEHDSPDTAHAVAYALCAEEHRKSGEPLDSEAFVYPEAVKAEAMAITVDVRGAAGNAEVQRMVAEGVKAGMRHVRKG